MLSNLKPREQMVISLRYGLKDGICWTQKDIGQFIGVSAERIRQIESSPMSQLRKASKDFSLNT